MTLLDLVRAQPDWPVKSFHNSQCTKYLGTKCNCGADKDNAALTAVEEVLGRVEIDRKELTMVVAEEYTPLSTESSSDHCRRISRAIASHPGSLFRIKEGT